MARDIGIGVIGAGRIGSLHADVLASRVAGATVSCVFDFDASRASEVASHAGARVVAGLDDVLAADDVDAVAICSSTDTHADLIAAAAAAAKAIFCEKPIALGLADVDRALAAVEAAGVPLMVGFNRRFDPGHASVRAAVADGSIGDVHVVRITSRDPEPPPLDYVRVSGGIFLDMTIHDFDMARFVTGSEVEEVYARGEVRVEPAFAAAGDLDTAVAVLRHADGVLTVIDNSRRAVYGFDQRVEAFGSRGVASSENPPSHAGLRRAADGSHGPRLPTFFLDRYLPSYIAEWDAFVAAVAGGGDVPVTGADGRAPLVIGLAAWRSVREGRPVRIEEIA